MTDVSGLTDLNLCIIPAVSVLWQGREPRDCVWKEKNTIKEEMVSGPAGGQQDLTKRCWQAVMDHPFEPPWGMLLFCV